MRVWLWLLYFFSVVNICLIEHCFRRLFTVYIFYFLFAVWFRDIYENNMFNCFVMGDTGIVTRRHINEESIRRDEVVVGRQFKDLSSGRRPHRRKLFCDRFMYVSHWKMMFVINFFWFGFVWILRDKSVRLSEQLMQITTWIMTQKHSKLSAHMFNRDLCVFFLSVALSLFRAFTLLWVLI